MDDDSIALNSGRRWLAGVATALGAFVVLGTVSAVWENPFFVRMTDAGGWEIFLLAALSLASGAYVAVRRPYCANTSAGVGGVAGFVGIACPVCNKILVLLFGGQALLTYFEPVRIYVAALGTLLVAAMALREWHLRRRGTVPEGAPDVSGAAGLRGSS